jgi:hypothetical protein
LEYLVHLGPKEIKRHLDRLRDAWVAQPAVTEIRARAHPQVVSVINRFALDAAALAMAIEAKILPWVKADTDAGIIACMQRWVKQPGNTDSSGELLRDIEQRRKAIAVTIDDRFIRLTVENGRLAPVSTIDLHKMERADEFDGYTKVKDGRFLVKPDAWQRWWAGLNVEEVNKHLQNAGLLIPDREGKASRLEVFKSGKPPGRFYVLVPAFIGSV